MLDINSYPDLIALADAGDTDGLLTALNERTIERTNSEPQSFRAVTASHGPTFAGTVLSKLEAAGNSNPLLKATYLAMCNHGINFADPITQAMLDSLGNNRPFSADETAKLKALGVWLISIAEQQIGRQATSDDVVAIIAQRVTQRAVDRHAQLVAEINNEVFAGNTFANMAELQAAVAGYKGA